jgi:hypothetical protein
MSFVNLPPSLYEFFQTINTRLDRLERSARLTAPNVATDPTNPRPGDIWLNTTSNTLKAVDKNGAIKTITWV